MTAANGREIGFGEILAHVRRCEAYIDHRDHCATCLPAAMQVPKRYRHCHCDDGLRLLAAVDPTIQVAA